MSQSIFWARDIDQDTLQVSIAFPQGKPVVRVGVDFAGDLGHVDLNREQAKRLASAINDYLAETGGSIESTIESNEGSVSPI